MPSEVILPRVDMDMATGKISKWLVDDGAPVKKGQPLFEIETDKAAMEIEAEASGTIRTLARAGTDDVAVGSVVAWIYREGEGEGAAPSTTAPAEDLLRDGQTDAPPHPAPATLAPEASNAMAPVEEACSDRSRATPLARRLARERGHDLSVLAGTGPRGRVQASDVPAAAAAPSPSQAAPVAQPAVADSRRAVPYDAPTDVPSVVSTAPAAPPQAPATHPAPQPAPARPSVTAALSTLRDGSGTPVVLLHGFGSESDAWRPFLQGYGGGRPVLALDLPGHGARPLGEAAGFDAVVDAVEEALAASGLGAFHFVGHSLGGAVAAAAAARGALDVRSLLLLAPAGLGPDINGAFVQGYLAASSEASLGPWLRELVAEPGAVTPAFVRATLKNREAVLPAQRRLAAALFPDGTQAFTVRADLARLACPVRVVVGTADRIVPARHSEALPGLVALHRLAGVGHLPQIEAREAVQAILAQTAVI